MQTRKLWVWTSFKLSKCSGYSSSKVIITRPLLNYPKLEDIFEDLNITTLFQGVNQNLKLIKEGVLNLITGKILSPAQRNFISLDGKTQFKKIKELNSFLLFCEEEHLSSTAGKSINWN